MEKNEIKKVLYKENPLATRGQEFDQVCFYEASTSIGKVSFEVPYREMGDTQFKYQEPAKHLIRWMI